MSLGKRVVPPPKNTTLWRNGEKGTELARIGFDSKRVHGIMTSSDAARQGLKLSESCIRDCAVAEQRTQRVVHTMSTMIFWVQRHLLLSTSI